MPTQRREHGSNLGVDGIRQDVGVDGKRGARRGENRGHAQLAGRQREGLEPAGQRIETQSSIGHAVDRSP
jgi:hypothetical protein